MITPSFSLTATERVLPKLALDFTTASLDPRVTFTRALNTATVTNSSGNVVTINANLPRFDYDPVTLACKGLLIEESRVNSFIYSENFNSWTTKNNVTISSASVTSPAGTQTADTITGNAGTSTKYVAQTVSLSAAPTVSVYVKAAGQNYIQILNATEVGGYANFNITAGAGAVGSKGSNVSASSITDAGNGWYRITASFTIATGSVGFRIYFANSATDVYNPSSSSTGSVYFWGAQIESGTFPTSYIPNLTTGTTTRNADVATMTGTNFSSWYNSTQGCFVTKQTLIALNPVTPGNAQLAVAAYNAATTYQNSIEIQAGYGDASHAELRVYAGGVQQCYFLPVTTAGTQNTFCISYVASKVSVSQNSTYFSYSGAVTIPSNCDTLGIGYRGYSSQMLNGWMKKIYYYPQAMIDNQVKALASNNS